MPTNVTVKRVKGKQVKISFSIAFNKDDPKANDIYAAFGILLREILTPEEGAEFLRQFEEAKTKVGA
jgi:hypothetical protein